MWILLSQVRRWQGSFGMVDHVPCSKVSRDPGVSCPLPARSLRGRNIPMRTAFCILASFSWSLQCPSANAPENCNVLPRAHMLAVWVVAACDYDLEMMCEEGRGGRAGLCCCVVDYSKVIDWSDVAMSASSQQCSRCSVRERPQCAKLGQFNFVPRSGIKSAVPSTEMLFSDKRNTLYRQS